FEVPDRDDADPMRREAAQQASLPSDQPALTFGCGDVDDALPGGGLYAGLHELQPQAYEDWPAALACALALAGRRSHAATAPILLCLQKHAARELGQLYALGLGGFGLTSRQILVVETDRQADT